MLVYLPLLKGQCPHSRPVLSLQLRGFSRGPPCALSCDMVDAAMLACAGLGKLERAFVIAQDAAACDLPVGRIAHGALLQLLCSRGDHAHASIQPVGYAGELMTADREAAALNLWATLCMAHSAAQTG